MLTHDASTRQNARRRVVVTGIGVVSPAGIGKEAFWQAIRQGRSCAGPIRTLEPRPGQRVHIAASVDGFSINDYTDRKQARFMERVSGFAYAAAQMAMEDADLTLTPSDSERAGTSIGTFAGPIRMARGEIERIQTGGIHKMNALSCIIGSSGASFGNITVNFQLRGPGVTVYAAETAGMDALGYAYRQIKYDEADVMIAGGSEAPILHSSLILFDGLGLLSRRNDQPERACRPFDAGRDGFVLGEGAAILVLEEMQHALRRGAHVYAELAGYAATCLPANDLPAHDAPGDTSLAMRMALADAALAPDCVEFIAAHGIGTQAGDIRETLAIKQALGEHAYDVPVSSIKPIFGYTLGADGALQAASCCLALGRGLLPPTINYSQPDPMCDLDYVPNQARAASPAVILHNSLSVLGKCGALVYKRWREGDPADG
ncbi:MAG TPA: beta-ketoacyl-[acyl-carrier-protein] synthase family protein [Anaerolineae bacterium]|nr:beta-ketoacyl-[acyl-carrier-protein] synthase family protein [Anaerolineae bacterium]